MTTGSLTLPNNAAVAKCARCKTRLLPGAGTRIECAYYCPICADQVQLENRALVESAPALEVIGRMLNWSRPLGFIDEERVKHAIQRCPTAGPRHARELAAAIKAGTVFTVWQVVDFITGN